MESSALSKCVNTVTFLSFSTLFSLFKCIISSAALLIILEMICRRRLHLYNEMHILLYAKVIFLILFCIESTAAMGIPVFDRLWYPTDPCKWSHSMLFCSPILLSHIFVEFCLPLVMLSFAIERTLVQLLFLSTKQSTKISLILLFFTIIASLSVVAVNVGDESSWDVDVPHCYSQSSGNRSGFWVSIICVIGDVTSLSLFIYLKYSGERILRTKCLTLDVAFRTRHSLLLVSSLLPVCIFHSFSLLFYILGMQVIVYLMTSKLVDHVTMKSLFTVVNILPFYALIFPIVLKIALKKLRKKQMDHFTSTMYPKSKNGDILPDTSVYFASFAKQWETGNIQTNTK